MSNFRNDILTAAGGEPIEAIVVSVTKMNDYERWGLLGKDQPVYTWDKVESLLDYEYSTDYGGAECHAITAWTKTKVLFVGTYDGATWVESVPRNPVAHPPKLVGGG